MNSWRASVGLVAFSTACGCRASGQGGSEGDGTSTAGDASEGATEEGAETDPPDVAVDDPCPAIVDVSVGRTTACGLGEDGQLKCWGCGSDLGYGLGGYCIGDEPDEIPLVDLVPVGAALGAVVASGHRCGLSGTELRCWGSQGYGELGLGFTEAIGDDEPVSAAGPVPVGDAVLDVAVNVYSTCVLLAGGAVRCWGGGVVELLTGTTIGDDEPASEGPILPLTAPAVRLFGGGSLACALLDDDRVECWGEGPRCGAWFEIWELATGQAVRDVANSSWNHVCAVLEDGTVRCWGAYACDGVEWSQKDYGYLGYPGLTEQIKADQIPPPIEIGGEAIQVEVDEHATCVLLANGDVRCFGAGVTLGRGDGCPVAERQCWIGDDEHPAEAPAVDLGGPVVALSMAPNANGWWDDGAVACALREDGEVLCWGQSHAVLGRGEVGPGLDIGDDETPAEAGPVRLCGP